MLFNPRARKSCLVLLIEHLDAVAYAIEGLEEQRFALQPLELAASADNILDYQFGLRVFVENIRARELSLIAHVDRARIQARKMGRYDAGISAYAALFNGGTQAFADQLTHLGHPIESDFDGNDQVLNFLKTRRLIAADCLSVEETASVSINEDYLIAGLVPVSVLAEQCASFLHLVENHTLLADSDNVKMSRVGYLRRLEEDATDTSLSA